MYGLLLAVHILSATIWTGGHIVLTFVVLPKVIRERSAEELLKFESAYERIGIPALVIQVITGLMLAYYLLPDISLWFDMSVPAARGITLKLTLLALTVLFALDARFRLVPRLDDTKIKSMAFHIIPVTILAILFVLTGVSFRVGWLA